MAGGSGRITVSEHAGQVSQVCHNTHKKSHYNIQYRKRIKNKKSAPNSKNFRTTPDPIL